MNDKQSFCRAYVISAAAKYGFIEPGEMDSHETVDGYLEVSARAKRLWDNAEHLWSKKPEGL